MEHGLIAWLIIGAISGWLAGIAVKGGGFGLIIDIDVGTVGALIGGCFGGVGRRCATGIGAVQVARTESLIRLDLPIVRIV